jgi:hypothetical protein
MINMQAPCMHINNCGQCLQSGGVLQHHKPPNKKLLLGCLLWCCRWLCQPTQTFDCLPSTEVWNPLQHCNAWPLICRPDVCGVILVTLETSSRCSSCTYCLGHSMLAGVLCTDCGHLLPGRAALQSINHVKVPANVNSAIMISDTTVAQAQLTRSSPDPRTHSLGMRSTGTTLSHFSISVHFSMYDMLAVYYNFCVCFCHMQFG